MVHLFFSLASLAALSSPILATSARAVDISPALPTPAGHDRALLPAAKHRREFGSGHLEPRASSKSTCKGGKVANYYSALVAFGASYTDNAHPRDAIYNGTVRDYYPYSNYGGRYTNGLIAVEYMVQANLSTPLKQRESGVKLLDYAYGGSVVENGLAGTGANSPAAVDQIATYLADLESGDAEVGAGRVLHYFNSGINPVTAIWNNALSAGLSNSTIVEAQEAVTANTEAAAAALKTISSSKNVASSVHGADFLLAGIPQMELVPTFGFQIPTNASASYRAEALSLLKTLGEQWNSEIKAFAASLKTDVAKHGGRVVFYDMAELWRAMHYAPEELEIWVEPVTTTCYNSTSGAVCAPEESKHYIYFDTLHPVTEVHELMAKNMNALVSRAE